MTFTPFLHFDGTCAEAMAFYAQVFGTPAPTIMRYADAPPGEAPKSDRVMYADISLGGQMLMASDSPEGTGAPQSGVSVMHGTADVPTARRIFEALAEGGSVIAPFGPTFWSQGFGMAKDRFGTHWIVSGPPA